ncbi:MAG: YchJ family protein [Planctomycetota bacterium]|nr:YchJ family protein [Planctomycetota bacterium]
MSKESNCLCGLEQSYEKCCGVFHSGRELPQRAEQLMRSRYSAFATQKTQYLIESLHPSQRTEKDAANLRESFQNIEWVGLEIVDKVKGEAEDNEGVVEFVASYKSPGPNQLQERSKFVKEDGRWFYVTGLMKPSKKLGRNDPCWCMSGKKMKKCHGRSS